MIENKPWKPSMKFENFLDSLPKTDGYKKRIEEKNGIQKLLEKDDEND